MSATRRLLIAEDDPNDRVLILRGLAKAELAERVDFVTDGQAAVDYLERIERSPGQPWPAAVVLDLKMPRLNGLQVLERIRANARQRFLPVVLLTSSSEPTDISRAYSSGVNAVVVKPSTFEAFLNTVSQVGAFWMRANAPPTE